MLAIVASTGNNVRPCVWVYSVSVKDFSWGL